MTYNFAYDNICLTGETKQPDYFYIPKLNLSLPVNGKELNKHIKFIRSPVFTSIEESLSSDSIKFHSVQECINADKKFVYWMTINPLENISQTNLNLIFLKSKTDLFKEPLHHIIDSINNGKCLLCMEDTLKTFSTNIEKQPTILLKAALRKAGIKNFNNICIITNTHDYKPSHFNTTIWEYFERAIINSNSENVVYDKKIINSKIVNFKRFLYLNHFARPHRIYFLYKLYSHFGNLDKNFACSFSPHNPLHKEIDIIEKRLKFSWALFFKKEMKFFNDSSLPLWFKEPTSNNNFVYNLSRHLNVKDIQLTTSFAPFNSENWYKTYDDKQCGQWTLFAEPWENTGIFIITETDYKYTDKQGKDFLTLTEKIFKPIKMKTPFIIFGQPFALKQLQTYGYKTFNTLWDESYDEIIDPAKRVEKIIETIDNLNHLSKNEFTNILQHAQSIVEYNYQHMMHSRLPEANVIKCLNDFMLG